MVTQIRNMYVKAIKMRWLTGGLNYAYLVSTEAKEKSWLIDPAESTEVLKEVTKEELKSVTAIVNTHSHYDHSQGNIPISQALKLLGLRVPVIAGSNLSPIASEIPEHLKKLEFGNIHIICIRTPCHTQDSICYYMHDRGTGQRALFTGDTLFTGGCGRFFEGTAEEMDEALNDRLVSVVGSENLAKTLIYPGHEYTSGNVSFIRKNIFKTPGENKAFDALESFSLQNSVTTGHFTLQDECDYNPFMRLDDTIVRARVGDTHGTWKRSKVMDSLRSIKNNMK